MSSQTRHRKSAAERSQLVKQYLASDLTQKQFCQKHHIGLSTLELWLRNHRRGAHTPVAAPADDGQANPQAVTRFIPLRFERPESASTAQQIVVEFPNQVIVRLAGSIDRDLLTHMIRYGGA